jgi:hypothetical protein
LSSGLALDSFIRGGGSCLVLANLSAFINC